MSTKALRKLVEMFGGVPLAHYVKAGQDNEGHAAWDAAKAELEAIEKAALVWYVYESNGGPRDSDALAPFERIALETTP